MICYPNTTHEFEPIFDELRRQVADLENIGVSEAEIARTVQRILDGACSADLEIARETEGAAIPVAFRFAWLIAAYAPAIDPVLVLTLPFCLEGVADGYSTIDDLLGHVSTSDVVADAPELPNWLPYASVDELETEVHAAVTALLTDPEVNERAIELIMERGGLERDWWEGRDSGWGWSDDSIDGRIDSRSRIRDALVSVFEENRASTFAVSRIADSLDARGFRRLAGELVCLCAGDAPYRTRIRASATLLDMARAS